MRRDLCGQFLALLSLDVLSCDVQRLQQDNDERGRTVTPMQSFM